MKKKTVKKIGMLLICIFALSSSLSVNAAGSEALEVSPVPTISPEALEVSPAPTVSPEAPEVSPVPTISPEAPEVTPTPTAVPRPVPENGWYTAENGKKQYYKKGNFVVGIQKIEKTVYGFDKEGYLLTSSWITEGGKKYRTDKSGKIIKNKLVTVEKKVYYLGSDGAMFKGWKKFKQGSSYFDSKGVRVTGLKKIGKKSYYFNSKGIMQTGTVKVKTTTYYLSDKGVLEAKKVNNKYYDANGKAMSKVKSQDFETLQRAKTIAAKITTSKMTKSQKLKKCFDWVISKPYRTRRTFSNFSGWPAVYANDHFVLGSGNCLADAAAFAYLAKAIGYKDVYVCTDCDGRTPGTHGWTEIGGLVYDPLFAEAKNYSKYYGARYGVYGLHAVLHIAI